jgi:hypothetical protein
VNGNTLRLRVAPDKLDDFLKSLTIVDTKTNEPVPAEYPTTGGVDRDGLVDVTFPLRGAAPHTLRLSYVTAAPAWKPSYRVALGKDGEIDLQGWAVVDNTSGEDWKDIRLGVGASSALSFRYDLRSVHEVRREHLGPSDAFAGTEGGANAAPQPGGPAAPHGAAPTPGAAGFDPVGTSSFESSVPMTVARGSSAMVSVLHERTQGEIVYLYDLESTAADAAFPARAVRMKNPTAWALETGPVSLFGGDRYIGEGLSEPIPAHATAFIPFARDRQVVAEQARAEDHDEITRIASVQSGVFTAELRHSHKRTFSLRNRGGERAVVYVRHVIEPGYTLTDATPSNERLGDAQLFREVVEPFHATEVAIDEDTKVARNLDIRQPGDLALLEAYLHANPSGQMSERALALIAVEKRLTASEQRAQALETESSDLSSRIESLTQQIAEVRHDNLGAALVRELTKKLDGLKDRAQKARAELTAENERLTLARVDFEEGAADLTLDPSAPSSPSASPSTTAQNVPPAPQPSPPPQPQAVR